MPPHFEAVFFKYFYLFLQYIYLVSKTGEQ